MKRFWKHTWITALCALACILMAVPALCTSLPEKTIGEAKLQPDGTGLFILPGEVLTADLPYMDTQNHWVYVEEPDGSAGIKVQVPRDGFGNYSAYVPNRVFNITGSIYTLNGERYIEALSMDLAGVSQRPPAYLMSGRSLGGGW